MYAPIELYEKYAPKRIVGYCTKEQPCSEITADAAAGGRRGGGAGRGVIAQVVGRGGTLGLPPLCRAVVLCCARPPSRPTSSLESCNAAMSCARQPDRSPPAPSPPPPLASPPALAAASELLKADNPAWSAKALTHARQVGWPPAPALPCLPSHLPPASQCCLLPALPCPPPSQLYKFATEFPGSYGDINDNGAMEIHRYFYARWGAYRMRRTDMRRTACAVLPRAVPHVPDCMCRTAACGCAACQSEGSGRHAAGLLACLALTRLTAHPRAPAAAPHPTPPALPRSIGGYMDELAFAAAMLYKVSEAGWAQT